MKRLTELSTNPTRVLGSVDSYLCETEKPIYVEPTTNSSLLESTKLGFVIVQGPQLLAHKHLGLEVIKINMPDY